jgi:hypothetical protein
MNDMTEGIHGGLPQRRSGWFAMVVAVGVLLIILGLVAGFNGVVQLAFLAAYPSGPS